MIKKMLHLIGLLLGVKESYREYVDEGIIDYSGQGRDYYGT